jgi:hypothetical protein
MGNIGLPITKIGYTLNNLPKCANEENKMLNTMYMCAAGMVETKLGNENFSLMSELPV